MAKGQMRKMRNFLIFLWRYKDIFVSLHKISRYAYKFHSQELSIF